MKRAAVRSIVVAVMLLAMATIAEAQQPSAVYRVGLLSPFSASEPRSVLGFDALRQGLRDLGYVDGKKIGRAHV